ncbi:MAG TPA: hypothetical protein P5567_08570 [Kiritimatiellia bacterium]|nr:hypothetical protein [Kiritimatiellia bacterium]
MALTGMPAGAQLPTLINYQGRLVSGTNLYSGAAQVVFRVYSDPTNTVMVHYQDTDTVSVADGLYSTFIGDEGAASDMSWLSMSVPGFWLEVAVNGTALRPRERLVAVPFSLLAGGVTNGAITTMMIADGSVMGYHLNNSSVDSTKIQDDSISFADMNQNGAANGQVMKWSGSAWVASDDNTGGGGGSLLGYREYGTFTPSPNAAGSDVIAMGKGCSAGGMNSIVGGGAYNVALGAENAVVDGGAYNTNAGGGAVIGGGQYNRIAYEGSNAVVAGGWMNEIDGYKSAIGGGQGNRIQVRAAYSVIGGGDNNLVATGSYGCVVAGGLGNKVQPGIYQGFIGAGGGNRMDDGDYGFIGAGQANRIGGDASWAVVGGGQYNTITNDADYAAIPGGFSNVAAGAGAFAAGREAQALHAGAFVWNGSSSGSFHSTADGQFLVNAPGRVGINVMNPQADLHVVGGADMGRLFVCPDALGTAGAELQLNESLSGNWGIALRYNFDSNQLEILGMTPSETNGPHLVVTRDEGRVGIGTQNLETNYLLSVGGAIRCEEIVVETGWADFVFEPGYPLPPLNDVERHIAEHGRLPGLPSAAEVAARGAGVGETQAKLLQKIEELTLYTIRQQKEIRALQQELAELRRENSRE